MSWTAYLPMLWQGAIVTMTITLAAIVCGARACLRFRHPARRGEDRSCQPSRSVTRRCFAGPRCSFSSSGSIMRCRSVGLSFDPITTGILVLAAHVGGYGAEIVRRGPPCRSPSSSWKPPGH